MAPLTATDLKRITLKLGKETDIALGDEFGVSRQYIKQLRDERDIPAFNSGPAMDTPWPIRFTQAAAKTIRRAMKVTGHTNRSEYVRDAVKEKNEAVLKGDRK